MEDMRVPKEKIDLLIDIFEDNLINLEEESLLDNKTSNVTVDNNYNLDFDFHQVRTLIKEVETGLDIL